MLLPLFNDLEVPQTVREAIKRPIRLNSTENLKLYNMETSQFPKYILEMMKLGHAIFFVDDSAVFLQKAKRILINADRLVPNSHTYSIVFAGTTWSKGVLEGLDEETRSRICLASIDPVYSYAVSTLAEERYRDVKKNIKSGTSVASLKLMVKKVFNK